jgi:predicted DNA-binding helix-hairpin-helix protein
LQSPGSFSVQSRPPAAHGLKTLARNNTKKHSKTQGNQYHIHFYESARDKREQQQKHVVARASQITRLMVDLRI